MCCAVLCLAVACAVEWNPNESTFDCVCHGSVFDRYGHCINGPAVADLEDLGERQARGNPDKEYDPANE